MADLEDLGYIFQPHTSAGRIPSDKGYRFYVDLLMENKEPVSYTHLDVYKRQDMFCRNRNLQRSGVLVLFGRSKTDESGIA